ncbi:hypothetical protein MRB53_007220 [Persea americana]|uniref:Uncharacterized protein n=1 Tax=Persea americana TaxID=3435 RepID=A0ACC2MIC6_PERAE|nr:hypothetical protein MRB53_007220 [Persea americana]
MNLGEIVVRILLKIAEDTTLFGEAVPPKLKMPFVLRTFGMAAMHQDTSENLDMVEEKMKEVLEIPVSTPMMREVVSCSLPSCCGAQRALGWSWYSSILKKIGRHESKQRTVVAVDGGLYEHYRLCRESLHDSMTEMLGSEVADNVIIEHSN